MKENYTIKPGCETQLNCDFLDWMGIGSQYGFPGNHAECEIEPVLPGTVTLNQVFVGNSHIFCSEGFLICYIVVLMK